MHSLLSPNATFKWGFLPIWKLSRCEELFVSLLCSKEKYICYPPFFRSRERVAAEGKIKIWQQQRQKKAKSTHFARKLLLFLKGEKRTKEKTKAKYEKIRESFFRLLLPLNNLSFTVAPRAVIIFLHENNKWTFLVNEGGSKVTLVNILARNVNR